SRRGRGGVSGGRRAAFRAGRAPHGSSVRRARRARARAAPGRLATRRESEAPGRRRSRRGRGRVRAARPGDPRAAGSQRRAAPPSRGRARPRSRREPPFAPSGSSRRRGRLLPATEPCGCARTIGSLSVPKEVTPLTITLPPDLSERSLERALAAFRAVVGDEAVLAQPEEMREFRDPFWFETWDDYEASAVVQPGSVEEVQAIVRIATEHKVPLWTSSQGRNNGYGGSSPRVRGSVVVNLRRMNRVLEIDEELAYAVVEPGVRWFDLYEAIKAGGHRLMLSIADLGWGSVVGNSLDNGVTYMPNGQDFTAPCGMEVVLPNGELLRTGMGAMPGNKAWRLYKRSLVLTLDAFFTQSNYGIVTKMGVWLTPYPETFMPFLIRVWNEDELGPLTDKMRRLRLERTLEGVPSIYNTLVMASVFTRRSEWTDSADPLPDATIDRIAKELNLGRWLVRAALWGDEAVGDHDFRKITAAFEQIPGATVEG